MPIAPHGQQKDPAKTPSPPGTYYSAQSWDSPKMPMMAPLPFNPFPDLPVHSIGEGRFIYDDREVDYVTLRQEAAEKAAAENIPAGEMLAAQAGASGPSLLIGNMGNGQLAFAIRMAEAASVWDLYFVNNVVAQRWQWRRIYSGVRCDANGEASFRLQQPDPTQGFFVILNAADDDIDGLGNGYEAWFNYNGVHTDPNDKESDGDTMFDGWEVEYGLKPTSSTGNDGASANPDGDFSGIPPFTNPLTNLREFNRYNDNSVPFGSFDPLGVFDPGLFGTKNRPVVWITTDTPNPVCGQVSFTIHRDLGVAADDDMLPLFVYYCVGGDLRFGTDYSLDPAPQTEDIGDQDHPDGFPRIFLAKIPELSQSVTIVASLIGQPVASGPKTLQVALTPYAVSRKTQVQSTTAWSYVVDLQNSRDRSTVTFDAANLTPSANNQIAQVCRDTARVITLRGAGNCLLSFMIVSPPAHGSLSDFNPVNGTVKYTPNAGYCGPDSFTFKAINGGVESQQATVTIEVCASGRALITGILPSFPGTSQTIITADFTDGSMVNSFEAAATFNGRGLAIHNDKIFYTGAFSGDFSIHVCSYGMEGSGSTTDSDIFQNTWRPGVYTVALAFHENVLHILTGYPDGPLVVFAQSQWDYNSRSHPK